MNFGILLPAFVLAIALLFPAALVNGADTADETSASPSEVIQKLKALNTNDVIYGTNGEVVSLYVPKKFHDAETLRLISKISSIRELRIFAYPTTDGRALTVDGVTALQALTNLTVLKFGCFLKEGLPPGVLTAASKLTRLRELSLYYSQASPGEYATLTNLVNLQKLSVSHCTNFSDTEIDVVKTLPNLKEVYLGYTGVTLDGANALKNSGSITNFTYKAATK